MELPFAPQQLLVQTGDPKLVFPPKRSAEKHSGKCAVVETCLYWLQVLSHNLCTVMRIPHDPVALEEDFKDDDQGPVSTQGYMPYLNTFILDKVPERTTLTLCPSVMMSSAGDAFGVLLARCRRFQPSDV